MNNKQLNNHLLTKQKGLLLYTKHELKGQARRIDIKHETLEISQGQGIKFSERGNKKSFFNIYWKF